MNSDAAWDNLKQILFAVIMAVMIKTSVVEAYKIPSASMEDTLVVGDFLLANKFIYGARLPFVDWQLPAFSDPVQGDVVIFYPPHVNVKYIKRCVAVGGDTIHIKDRIVYVNDEIFELPEHGKYTSAKIKPRRPGGQNSFDNYGPQVIPEGYYFMMGDTRDNSSDSRDWGMVPRGNVIGSALMIHWSWSDENFPSPEVSLQDPLSVPRMFIYNAVHFLQKVRWSRLFNVIS